MTGSDQTRVAPNPSDSVLYTLARAAMGVDVAPGEATWPRLDLNDPAQREFGDYELLEEIGRGGMGVVYRAHQRSLDREVAIKFIAAGIEDSFNVARFLAEARAAARLMHPNIVPVHEVDSIDGLHYFSMPLVRGRSLATQLESGALVPIAATALLLKLCEAIDYAHRLGLLHLDLKPANILLDERSEPLIADFGLARHMDTSGGVDAQEVSGTPAFMAPEQILIKQYRLTPATDIYALGAILYRCLTGVSPHGEGKPDDVIRCAAAGRVRPPRELNAAIPRDIDAICMTCLELQPSDRYASVASLADDLRRVRDGLPVSVRHIGITERAQRWFKREPKLAFATTAAAVALVLGGTATAWQWREASTQRDLAMVTSELGAWLYTQKPTDDSRERANDTIKWLRARLPDRDIEQAGVLTAFVTALKVQDDRLDTDVADGFIGPIVRDLGQGYRQSAITALQSGMQPDRYALAAELAWFDAQQSGDASTFSTLLDQAIKTQPNSVQPWHIAATFCLQQCLHPEAPAQLIRIDPDNAYHWLLAAKSESQTAPTAMLAEAAKRHYFNDYFGELLASYPRAIRLSGVLPPSLLAEPAQVIFPGDPPEFVVGVSEASAFPLTPWGRLTSLCDPRNHLLPTQTDYDHCRIIGTTMARSNASLLARMVGSYIARRLSKGTPLEQEMIELDRRYAFVTEMQKRAPTKKMRHYPVQRAIAIQIKQGELEAAMDQLAFAGLPSKPPKGWQPADPRDLMLPEEREAYDQAHPSVTR